MRLRTAQDKLKIEHSIIEGVRDLLVRLLEKNIDHISYLKVFFYFIKMREQQLITEC